MSLRRRLFTIVEPACSADERLSHIYDYVMLIAIAMGILPLMFRGNEPWMQCLDIMSCAIFSVDYLLRWVTADCRASSHNRFPFLTYPFTWLAIIDLLSILPTFTVLNSSFKLLRMARFLKILRIVRVFRYYPPILIMLRVIRRERLTLFTVLTFAMLYIFVTALIMFNAEVETDPRSGEVVFATFFDALYWAACTLTTVGYGDICPVSLTGRLISMVSAIMGVAIIALPSGIITAAYLDELRSWKSQREERKQ